MLDEATRRLLECLFQNPNGDKVDFDKIFLDAQTSAYRFKNICELEAEEGGRTWQRHRSTAKSFFSEQ